MGGARPPSSSTPSSPSDLLAVGALPPFGRRQVDPATGGGRLRLLTARCDDAATRIVRQPIEEMAARAPLPCMKSISGTRARRLLLHPLSFAPQRRIGLAGVHWEGEHAIDGTDHADVRQMSFGLGYVEDGVGSTMVAAHGPRSLGNGRKRTARPSTRSIRGLRAAMWRST